MKFQEEEKYMVNTNILLITRASGLYLTLIVKEVASLYKFFSWTKCMPKS